jgi:antitoxin (DNA-binding transcriptional repressor) of toxin-antitoxin stability system
VCEKFLCFCRTPYRAEGADGSPYATSVKTISQREFRNSSAAVDAVERGETFQVTRRGVPIAEVRPIPGGKFTPVAELKRAFAGLPGGDYDTMRAEADAAFGEEGIGDWPLPPGRS